MQLKYLFVKCQKIIEIKNIKIYEKKEVYKKWH